MRGSALKELREREKRTKEREERGAEWRKRWALEALHQTLARNLNARWMYPREGAPPEADLRE